MAALAAQDAGRALPLDVAGARVISRGFTWRVHVEVRPHY
jgi:hypothetical protein